jgi:hypothetical protein
MVMAAGTEMSTAFKVVARYSQQIRAPDVPLLVSQ